MIFGGLGWVNCGVLHPETGYQTRQAVPWEHAWETGLRGSVWMLPRRMELGSVYDPKAKFTTSVSCPFITGNSTRAVLTLSFLQSA